MRHRTYGRGRSAVPAGHVRGFSLHNLHVTGFVISMVVSFLLGVGVTLVMTSRRRKTGAHSEISETVLQAITGFGEEIGALSFDPAGREPGDAALKEYSRALDAYTRAAQAVSENTALVALDDGRKALIRLEARVNGRAVPIDAQPPAVFAASDGARRRPERPTGERFLFTGTGPAEFMIDRPEPGRMAIAEVIADGSYILRPITRTEEILERHSDLARYYADDATDSRLLLRPAYTHLMMEPHSEDTRWSVRIRSTADARLLDTEHQGRNPEVLAYTGGPADLTVQVQGDWRVDFWHRCPDGDWSSTCSCLSRISPKGVSTRASGVGEGRTKMWLPGPGLIRLDGTCRAWSLHVPRL